MRMKICNKLFVHLTCASTEVPSKTWTNIHSIIIHILNGFTAFKILIHENWLYLLRWCVFSALSSMCAVPAPPVIFIQLHICTGEWTQHLLKVKWIEYHHLQQKYSFRQTREMVRLCAIHWWGGTTMTSWNDYAQFKWRTLHNPNCPQLYFFPLAFVYLKLVKNPY